MADTYVTLSSLKHYDEKIKGVIDEKQDKLVGTDGQIVSFDANGNVIAKDFLDNIEISQEDDNQIEAKNDGIYVAPTDLGNYYTKNEIYSRTEVDNVIANIQLNENIEFETENIDFTTQY